MFGTPCLYLRVHVTLCVIRDWTRNCGMDSMYLKLWTISHPATVNISGNNAFISFQLCFFPREKSFSCSECKECVVQGIICFVVLEITGSRRVRQKELEVSNIDHNDLIFKLTLPNVKMGYLSSQGLSHSSTWYCEY